MKVVRLNNQSGALSYGIAAVAAAPVTTLAPYWQIQGAELRCCSELLACMLWVGLPVEVALVFHFEHKELEKLVPLTIALVAGKRCFCLPLQGTKFAAGGYYFRQRPALLDQDVVLCSIRCS